MRAPAWLSRFLWGADEPETETAPAYEPPSLEGGYPAMCEAFGEFLRATDANQRRLLAVALRETEGFYIRQMLSGKADADVLRSKDRVLTIEQLRIKIETLKDWMEQYELEKSFGQYVRDEPHAASREVQ